MKKLLITILIFSSLLVFNSRQSYSLGWGLNFGLATPNEKLSDVYNGELITGEDFVGQLFGDGTNLGFHIGAKLRLPLSESALLQGGIGFNRFTENNLVLVDPSNPSEILGTADLYQNIIPISAGINYYLTNSVIDFYLTGDLTYNYMSYTYGGINDYVTEMKKALHKDSDHRVGYSLGLGFDMNALIGNGNLEVKYNVANLIGRPEGEDTKAFVTLTLGIYFGGTSPKKSSD
jgi:hypothetical protein